MGSSVENWPHYSNTCISTCLVVICLVRRVFRQRRGVAIGGVLSAQCASLHGMNSLCGSTTGEVRQRGQKF